MRELALFAGAGGGILGGKLLGWQTVCAVEINSYCASILCRRQDEGILAPFPIWDDVTTFDGRPWRGVVDVISGGFPCQDISAAGRGAGITGERSGLWSEMARIIGEVRPRFVFVENSPMLVSRGLGRVLADLATLGLMRNGALSERTTPEHLTSETESGYWPTPQVGMIRGENYTLETSFKHWQEGRQVHLSQVVRDQRMWPTPSANNYEQTDLDKLLERRERIKSQGINGNGFGLTLANAVLIEERKTWATPRKSDFKSCGPVGSKSHHHMTEKQYLCAQVKEEDQPTGHLNPDWTEWLMGWPIGWTDSKQLETDKFQQWWNSHGERLETVD